MFRYYNANSKNNLIDDCVIRACSVAEDISWDIAYKKLSDLARQVGLMIDDVKFVEDYLDSHYFRFPCSARNIKDFIKEYPLGTYLITMLGHITVVKDGYLYDTFDCSYREIQDVWKVK